MNDSRIVCPLSGSTQHELIFDYKSAPVRETKFKFIDYEHYSRQVYRFLESNHFISVCDYDLTKLYDASYSESTYGSITQIKDRFDFIMELPSDNSDNRQRFKFIENFFIDNGISLHKTDALDIGSGLGVFPSVLRDGGATVTVVEPDSGHREFLIDSLKFPTHQSLKALEGTYGLITLNKVLEHVESPQALLNESLSYLTPDGFIYVELPDGETAQLYGSDQEEFFIEHLHVFSWRSMTLLLELSNLTIVTMQRIKEPSGKYTLRAIARLSESIS